MKKRSNNKSPVKRPEIMVNVVCNHAPNPIVQPPPVRNGCGISVWK